MKELIKKAVKRRTAKARRNIRAYWMARCHALCEERDALIQSYRYDRTEGIIARNYAEGNYFGAEYWEEQYEGQIDKLLRQATEALRRASATVKGVK